VIPAGVLICGRTYSVSVQPMGSGAIGSCSNDDQDITIEADMHSETQASVLLHEVIEAINASMNLNLRHKTISALETALYAVLTQNPSWWGDQ